MALAHNLTGYALLDPDEGRNAEIVREMATTGDYVLPHLNGLPYLDKPTLYFAVGAVSMKILGPTVLAARLPSLLFTLGTIVIVGLFARRILGRGAGLTAAIATAATPFTMAYARIVIFDSALTFFVVSALAAFYLAIEERVAVARRTASGKGEGWSAIAWVAIALGIMTKGPIAIVLPLLVALPFAVRYRAWRAVIDPIGFVLCGVIVIPWMIAVTQRIPDFLEYALVTETAGRFSTSELGRTGPFWYFLAIFPAATLPWTLVLAGSIRNGVLRRDALGRIDRRVLYLLFWIVLPLLFFTLSQSKRPQYVLPMVPAVALLTAGAWQVHSGRVPGARWGAAGLFALGLFFAAAGRFVPSLIPAGPDVAAAIPRTAVLLGVTCIVAGSLAWFTHRRKDVLMLAFSLPIAAIPLSSHTLMKEIGTERSSALLAEAVADAAGGPVRVVGVGVYPPSLPFYLQQTIIVATADASELTSNYLTRHVREYRGIGSPLRQADWWQEALLTCSEPTVFVTSVDEFEVREALGRLDLIIATPKYVAYGPCGTETLARTEQ